MRLRRQRQKLRLQGIGFDPRAARLTQQCEIIRHATEGKSDGNEKALPASNTAVALTR
jgi:hypothetical protein